MAMRKSRARVVHVTDRTMRLLPLVMTIIALGTAGPALAEGLPEVRSKGVAVLDAVTGAEIFGRSADEVMSRIRGHAGLRANISRRVSR